MENYHFIVKEILELKRNSKNPRKFETENNHYHNLRIQSTDIDIITNVIEKLNVNNFEFAAELYCRTLLAQIAHFKYTEYFNFSDYESSCNLNKFHFVETVGWCPTRCQRHIRPLVIPLLILYWNLEIKNDLNGSDHLSDKDALEVFDLYLERFEVYKLEFSKRIIVLLKFLIKESTPFSVKTELINDFSSFTVALNAGD